MTDNLFGQMPTVRRLGRRHRRVMQLPTRWGSQQTCGSDWQLPQPGSCTWCDAGSIVDGTPNGTPRSMHLARTTDGRITNDVTERPYVTGA